MPGRRSTRARSRTAGSCRGWSVPRPRSRARIDSYDFSHAALELYDFVYGELCDWYLELVKPRLYDRRAAGRRQTLLHVLDADARAGPPDDPVRHRGDLQLRARRRRPAGGGRAASEAGALDEPAEADARARDRGGPGAARLARSRRRARPARSCRRGSRPTATRRRPSTSRGWRGSTFAADGGEPVDGGAGARRRGRDPRRRRPRPRGGRAQARRRRGPGSRRRSSAGRAASSPTRASSPRRRPPVVQAERDKLARLRPSWRRCELLARGRRALPALARAVRHAVRARPHAPADDRARPPGAAVRVDPRRRHERQVLDDADDRRDPRRARAAHRRLSVAAPVVVRRADPDRRRRSRSDAAFAAAVRARGARRRAGRPLARRRTTASRSSRR